MAPRRSVRRCATPRSVSAIWPPAGLGIAALYLWGLRWWPGVLLAEIVVNGELLLGDRPFPIGSLLGQQAGNMAEIIVGALLLRRLIGANAGMDRLEQVGGMLVALAVATAISATAGTVSMVAGGVVDASDATEFWRTWWLGDTSGGLVVLPLILAWARDPVGAWRAHPDLGGRRRHRERHRAHRRRVLNAGTDQVLGVSGADLGGVPVRPAGRDAVRRDHRRCGDRRDRERRRAVLPSADRPPHAQHAALHLGRGADDAVPEWGDERPGAFLPGARRSTQTGGRPRNGGTASDRSRSPRFRLAGPVLDGPPHTHGAEGIGARRR